MDIKATGWHLRVKASGIADSPVFEGTPETCLRQLLQWLVTQPVRKAGAGFRQVSIELQDSVFNPHNPFAQYDEETQAILRELTADAAIGPDPESEEGKAFYALPPWWKDSEIWRYYQATASNYARATPDEIASIQKALKAKYAGQEWTHPATLEISRFDEFITDKRKLL